MRSQHARKFFNCQGLCGGTKRLILVAACFTALAYPSWAALGDNEQSVSNDTARLKATRRTVVAQAYTIHEIQTSSGYVVKEYISSGGSVFGISWEGPGGVDLQLLLGAYFDQFQKAMAQRQRNGRGPVLLDTPGLVFQQAGHMPTIRGRAYVPQLVPADVDVNDIR